MRTTIELATQILAHKKNYYLGTPTISDAEFDALEDELRSLDPDHAVLHQVEVKSGPSSKTVRKKRQHIRPMLSLEKTYDFQELLNWKKDAEVVGMHKIDGVSVSLIYNEKGQFIQGKTRGDGYIGEDVTDKMYWVDSIILEHPELKNCEVRGELNCTKKSFEMLSVAIQQRGNSAPVNARNVVTGILARKQNIDLAKYFHFTAFDLTSAQTGQTLFQTEIKKCEQLTKLGFSTPNYVLLRTTAELKNYIADAQVFKENGDYEIDGVVLSYNDLSTQETLGHTQHHPKYKISYKWKGEFATTTIEEIEWSTGRLGVITPVANITPVFLAGASISRVSLHNASFIQERNLKKGDKIVIIRSGEVIPKFERVEYDLPKNCPSCSSELNFDGVKLYCLNSLECPDQIIGGLENWATATNIEDLSVKRIEQLYQNKIVLRPSDFYKITPEVLLSLEGNQEVLANKLYNNIQKSKQITLKQFLCGLNIAGMQMSNWEKIIDQYSSLDQIQNLSIENIENIPGFSTITAQKIVQGLAKYKNEIHRLLSAGVSISKPSETSTLQSKKLQGQNIVITGTFIMPRKELEDLIKLNGGHIASSVTTKTTMLLISDPNSTSSKTIKAKELKIPMLDFDQFNNLLA